MNDNDKKTDISKSNGSKNNDELKLQSDEKKSIELNQNGVETVTRNKATNRSPGGTVKAFTKDPPTTSMKSLTSTVNIRNPKIMQIGGSINGVQILNHYDSKDNFDQNSFLNKNHSFASLKL